MAKSKRYSAGNACRKAWQTMVLRMARREIKRKAGQENMVLCMAKGKVQRMATHALALGKEGRQAHGNTCPCAWQRARYSAWQHMLLRMARRDVKRTATHALAHGKTCPRT
eukprot:397245-Pelagomonas_calceolata.AAC.5